jgi:AcrR family transcriptional regulator
MTTPSSATSPPLEGPPPGPFAIHTSPTPPFLLGGARTGRDEFPREVLDRNHRNRILRGAVASLADHGYNDISVERLIAAAGVSRFTFYANFPDKEACYVAAYDRAVEWVEREVTAALSGAGTWPDKVHVACDSTLALLGTQPGLARLIAAEILCVGPAGRARHQTLIDRLIPLLRFGRVEQPASGASTPRLELALLSGFISVVAREASAGRGDRLAGMAPDLAEFLLVPYLGHAAARRVATRRRARLR